jgi:hypothetical protein
LGVFPVLGVNNLALLFDNVESIEYTELVTDLTEDADLGEELLRIILNLGATTRNTLGDGVDLPTLNLLGVSLRISLGALRILGEDTLLLGEDTLRLGVETLRIFWMALRVGVDTLRLGEILASFLMALRVGVDTTDLGETMRSF